MNRKTNLGRNTLGIAGILMLLSACGGGGSSGGEAAVVPTFTVSGTISIPAGSVMDSDTSDEANSLSNNSILEAQPLPNPAFVAGYISRSAGILRIDEQFNYEFKRDTDDFYRVSLTQGQAIRLYHIEALEDSANTFFTASLSLFDSQGVQIGSPVTSSDRIKSVTAPATGTYVVKVSAGGSKALYQLVVGFAESQAAMLEAEFVPDEVIVQLVDDEPGQRTSSQHAARTALAMSGFRAQGMLPKRQNHSQWLMDTTSFQLPDAEPALKQWRAVRRTTGDAEQQRQTRKMRTLLALEWLNMQPAVAQAHPNYLRHTMYVPNDPQYARQWHLPLMSLENAWDDIRGLSMTPVNVAVIDTGIRVSHEDIASALLGGYDFIDNDTNPTDPGEGTGSKVFHGTHVAGTIGALADNQIGVASVAGLPDKDGRRWLKVIPLRVLDAEGGGTDFDIGAAIRLASSGSGTDPDTGQAITLSGKARVINLSLGGTGACGSLESAIEFARAQGAVVVAAAGNENSSIKNFPAACPGVISVSAVGQTKLRAPYSNFAASLSDNWIDVAAPGGNSQQDVDADGFADGILSLGRETNGYLRLEGTSMAAPHVSGVMALMLGVNPTLTPAQIDGMLSDGSLTQDLGDAGVDRFYGNGLLDAFKSVRSAASRSIPATLITSTSALSFDADDSQKNLELSNGGTEAFSITSVVSSEPWLEAVATSVDTNGLGTYRVRVDRSMLSPGLYSATLTVNSSLPEAGIIKVSLQVVDTSSLSNAGRHYILLVSKHSDGTFETANETFADPVNGTYQWSLAEVKAGEYYLVAGTDIDNDGFICHDGEFCAEYPVVGGVSPINVSGATSGLSMSTVYMFAQTIGNPSATARESAPKNATINAINHESKRAAGWRRKN
ncbi:MAG: S8 family serine peptidase [Hahellaceae bacterium]|nr:S8 family serine peptidase [Hahellaceae bacterium]MCP5169924.1 S8 family serine peptidase [Hahellaceae bacterium]